MTRTIKKVLIANRGEIACRIIKTLRKMGIASVAIYSDADRNSRHVLEADEAVHVGPAPAIESYLNIDNIIIAAKSTHADAIHPGYGFLSENPGFAERCQAEKLIFIGPRPDSIRAMGSKSAAKRIMENSGVPLIPGYHGDNQEDAFLLEQAKAIGFPVIIKAALGGGGKGMRVVNSATDFNAALSSCRREAMSSFNNDSVLVEKYIGHPRHVEIQVFCDQHGNAVHLFDRDCSIQRRHQKIVEEAPAPSIPQAIQVKMADAALKAARAIDYLGAGTVEFLYDGNDQFYFMEMNTRLQVEHPVTEMITGEDLVEWQVRVAMGQALPKAQSEIRSTGHAIELRICAEDCRNNFMPSIGKIQVLQEPSQSATIRLDTGIKAYDEISVYYDPMFAKLIVWGPSREAAISQLQTALQEYCIAGVTTNTDYLFEIVTNEQFIAQKLSTHFLTSEKVDVATSDETDAEAAAYAYALWHIERHENDSKSLPKLHNWRLNQVAGHPFNLRIGKQHIHLVAQRGAHNTQIHTDRGTLNLNYQPHNNAIKVSGDLISMPYVFPGLDHTLLFNRCKRFTITDHIDDSDFDTDTSGERHSAPMPGLITKIYVQEGQKVNRGDPLVAMEAMKMEHLITAHYDGNVISVNCKEGMSVTALTELVEIG